MHEIESSQSSDILLLRLLQEGNTRAFDTLFEKYWQKAYADAYKRLGNHDDAKDIVQDIFSHIWFNRETTHIDNLAAYLHVAVRNKVIKLVAKQKVTHPFFDILENASVETGGADSDLLWKDFFQSYDAIVQALPPKRQEIFKLRFHEDLRTKEIAKQLGITIKTVQNQLGKAIETLKVSLLRLFYLVMILASS
jgi:RNA polymerase sigma-70 factor (ECF subfamily)